MLTSATLKAATTGSTTSAALFFPEPTVIVYKPDRSGGNSIPNTPRSRCDARASINTPNIGNSALIIEELDWGGQDALNTCENSFFGPHLGLGRQKNVIRLGQTPDVKLPY